MIGWHLDNEHISVSLAKESAHLNEHHQRQCPPGYHISVVRVEAGWRAAVFREGERTAFAFAGGFQWEEGAWAWSKRQIKEDIRKR